MTEFDPGPPAAIARHLAKVPSYAPRRDLLNAYAYALLPSRAPDARPRHNNSVERPGSDLRHTLIWRAPKDQP